MHMSAIGGKADIRIWRRHACFLVVLDQMRTGNAQFTRPLHGLCHQFLVGHRVECASLAHFAPVDDEAAYFGFAHRALHRSRRLTKLQCELPCLLQLAQDARAEGAAPHSDSPRDVHVPAASPGSINIRLPGKAILFG